MKSVGNFASCFEKSAMEAYQMLQQVLKKDAMIHTQFCEWFECFKWGEKSIEDNVHSGHPLSSWNDEIIEKFCQEINEDHRFIISEISGYTRGTLSLFQQILTEDL